VRELLGRRDFRLLLVGQSVSALGDWMGTVALMVLVHDLTQSSTAVAGVLVLRLVPAALAGPVVSRLARRWDRKRTMLVMDLVRASMIALVPFVRGLWWVYLWAFLIEVASLVFLPARDASIPDLAGGDDLPLANGLVLGSSYGTIPLGAGAFAAVAAVSFAGGSWLGEHPLALVFWVDAVTYLVSFAMVSRVAGLEEPAHAPGDEPTSFAAAFRIPLVRAIAPAAATAALGLGTLFSIGIVFVREVLHASDAEFGVLIALFGVGAALGLAALRLVSGEPSVTVVRWGVALQGWVIALMSLAPGIGLTFVGAVGFGAATAASLSAGMSVLQDRLQGDDRILGFAAFHVLIRGGLSLAAIGAGVAADVVESVKWPVVGTLPATRVVLFSSGVVVALASLVVREEAVSA
jgi:MFS family permease